MKQQQLFLIGGSVLIVLVIIVAVVVSTTDIIASRLSVPAGLYEGLTRRVTSDGTPVLGDPAAPTTLVEFIDFSCPHCTAYHSAIIQQFIHQYVATGKARLELRILAGVDPEGSPLAARTALCAGEQNAFWEMTDALIALRQTYGRSAFRLERITQLGEGLNLNSSELNSCLLDETSFQEVLHSTVELALSLDVQTTPAILLRENNGFPHWLDVNGHRLTGRIPYDTLAAQLSSEG